MSCKEEYTVTFDEKVKGWTSFHSFFPDIMVGMNNSFYSFKDGNLYLHHEDTSSINTYYGEQYPSKISVMMNDSPSEIKELQAVSLEGSETWETVIRAYVANVDDFIESSIKRGEYVQKEGIWFAHARRNESTEHFDSKSTYGIGSVTGVVGTTLTINGGSGLLCVGDVILKGSDVSVVGTILSITGDQVEVSSLGSVVSGDFILGMKDPRIEGGSLRGYTLRFDLEIMENKKVELFAINAEFMKSYT